MSKQFTPIPEAVIQSVPGTVARHDGAFDVRVSAFDGNDGEQMFAIDVYTDRQTVTPTDRRQKPYVAATQTTYFFNEEGAAVDEPMVWTGKYR
jgi:hypothetical protein